MQNYISTQFYYNSNFPFKNGVNYTNYAKSFKYQSSDKIFCKNFLILYFFIRCVGQNSGINTTLKTKVNFYSNPPKKNIFNVLKAPYKNKLARNQLTTPLYKFSVKLTHIYPSTIIIHNPTIFFLILSIFLKSFSFFESNVAYLNKIRLLVSVVTNSYWNYNF